MNIAIWHCYHYARHDTFVLAAETQEALEAKVRQAVIDDWDDDYDDDDDGPMPEDFDELMEKYEEIYGGACYFGDWGYTVIDGSLCTRMEDKQ
jgi:hypothetical protein